MLERIKRIFRRKSRVDELEELVEKAKAVEIKEEKEEIDPWKEFIGLCKDTGYDYREVIAKAAWYYLEESGAIGESPLEYAKEVAETLKEFDDAIRKISEPSYLKKMRMYKDVVREMAEFKQAVKDLREGKISTMEAIAIVKEILNRVSGG